MTTTTTTKTTNTEPQKRFDVNRNGLRVLQSCASCFFRGRDKTGMRVCKLGAGIVEGYHVCNHYVTDTMFVDAGGGQPGAVKRKEWIAYLSKIRVREWEEGVLPKNRRPLSEIIAEYETKFGSRYYTDAELNEMIAEGRRSYLERMKELAKLPPP